MDGELRQALDDLGRRIDAARDEARAAREEARAAREEARAARAETQSMARVVAVLADEYRALNRLVTDLSNAQIEFSRQLQALTERLGRLVSLHTESRTQETDRYADFEARLRRLEQSVTELQAARPAPT